MNVLNIIWGIIKFAILISIVVGIHELGHLLTAKLFNVFCFEYSIGMGPVIYQKKNKETWFSVRAFPIGGYVSMAGEAEVDEDTIKARGLTEIPYERTINGIAKWKQVVVMLAGVTMNFILAFSIFAGILLYSGQYSAVHYADITGIVEGSVAETVGLEVGDKIERVKFLNDNMTVNVDGEEVDTVYAYMIGRYTKPYELTIDRNGTKHTYNLHLTENDELGIELDHFKVEEVTLKNCIPAGFDYMIYTMKQTAFSIGNLFLGRGLETLGGPVAMYSAVEETNGVLDYLLTMAIISVSVGVLNVAPIPAMDGGRALMTTGEIVVKKDVPEKIKNASIRYSMGLLLMLMGGLLMKDIWVFFLQKLFI